MIILFICLLFLYIQNSINQTSIADKKKRLIWIYSIILLFLSVFRHYGVGADTVSYIVQYGRVADTGWDTLIKQYNAQEIRDPFFEIFLKCLTSISSSYFLFFVFDSALFLFAFGRFIYKNVNNTSAIAVSYLLYINYFYAVYPNAAMRQTIAFALFLLVYDKIKEHRNLLVCILVIVAASFIHRSVLITLLLIPVSYIKTNRVILGSILLLPVVYTSSGQLSGLLVSFPAFEQYQYYLDNSSEWEPPIMLMLQMAIFLAFILLTLYKQKQMKCIDFNVNSFALSVALIPIVWLDPSFLRMIHFFMIAICICIPNIIELSSQRNIKNILIVALLLRVLIYFPEYKFLWQEMQLHERYQYTIEYYLNK